MDIRQLGEKEAFYRLRSGKAFLSLPKRISPLSGSRSPETASSGWTPRAGIPCPPTAERRDSSCARGRRRVRRCRFPDRRKSRRGGVHREEHPYQPGRNGSGGTGPGDGADRAGGGGGVPPAVAGELRQYGEWVSTPEYGYAWRPYVEDGWEPYDYGRWTWVAPYGYTWVGYEPWGWWPYHTGWWWSSPGFGWVWSPYHSFASVHYTFGHSRYFGHHSRFFPSTVRFVGRDRFVRWVPSRPGRTRSDSRSFARGDSRLARWD